MCAPILYGVSLALSAAATYSSIQTQKKQAASQIAYQTQLRKQNQQTYMVQSNQLSDAKAQENQQMAVQKQKAFLANQASLSQAKAQAGAMGMSGNNLASIFQDFAAKQTQFDMGANRQHTFNVNALNQQTEGLKQNFLNADLQLARPVALPDTNSAWLGWGANAVNSYQSMKR